MGRDAFGADWGGYRREQAERKYRRREVRPSIYLAYRVRAGVTWFGEPEVEVKLGQTTRSPSRRRRGLGPDFVLLASWPVPVADLDETEAECIAD